MNRKLFHLTFAAALALGSTAVFWQTAQPASADEYLCTDRNSGDWFTTDHDQSGNRDRNVVCRIRDVFSDRQNRDRNYSDNSDNGYSRDGSYSRDGYSRDAYSRGYDDACAHNNFENSADNRNYAEGYRDGQQRCDRPQRWDRNSAH